jgi:hypothetical protein
MKSSRSLLTSRWRRRDFGDMTIRGLRNSRTTCREDAGGEGCVWRKSQHHLEGGVEGGGCVEG